MFLRWDYDFKIMIRRLIKRRLLVHESPGLKPDWLSDINLFSLKDSNILSNSNL